uniref:CRAL-TRIO domain-containing protein n=1 Tax=Takifugu rubripes TaxID=31033 RepID=H2SHQ9_TAKRU
MEITDAGPQVAASRSSRTTSPRPSSPSRLRMMMMMSLGWTSTWTPWKRHPTVNLCPSPSTTWKVTFRQAGFLPVICSTTSRCCPLDDLRRLGVASRPRRGVRSSPRSRFESQAGSGAGADQPGLGALEQEDVVDKQGTRWRCFSTGDPPQENWVNMSVLQPFLRVLSHGGYYGDGTNDIIVFSSCFLPENSLENYQYVMDNLFRYVVGTLELMVAENYVIVYFCAGGQKDRLPGIGWLRECYTTIDRRLRKNLKGFYVVHPTWYIKALITIIKPFISSKFSRKLRFVENLKDLSELVPTEHVQIPDCVSFKYSEEKPKCLFSREIRLFKKTTNYFANFSVTFK